MVKCTRLPSLDFCLQPMSEATEEKGHVVFSLDPYPDILQLTKFVMVMA
jgi:hypothetical protein